MEKRIKMVEISKITARKDDGNRLDTNEIKSLAASIKRYGLMQPISVTRTHPSRDKYNVIFGNRRLAACKYLKWDAIPVIVDTDKTKIEERSIIENVYRKDFTVFEVANVIKKFLDSKYLDEATGKLVQYKPADVAMLIGKSKSYITFYTTYINMDEEFKQLVEDKNINDINNIYELAKTYKKEKNKGKGEQFLKDVASKTNINRETVSNIKENLSSTSSKVERKDIKIKQEAPLVFTSTDNILPVMARLEIYIDNKCVEFVDASDIPSEEVEKVINKIKNIFSKYKK